MVQNLNAFLLIMLNFYSDLPVNPPPTNDPAPTSWWVPKCCDKSLLVGTFKHGCESYYLMRCDPALCFVSHIGPADTLPTLPAPIP